MKKALDVKARRARITWSWRVNEEGARCEGAACAHHLELARQ
jgi:hypothetical protein